MKTKFDDLMTSFNRVVSFRDGTESQQKAIDSFQEDIMRVLKEIRNETLEEAATHCATYSVPPPGETQSDGQFAALHLSTQILSMKS